MARQDYAQKRRANNSASRKPAPRKKAAPPPPPRRPWGLALLSLIGIGGLGVLIYLLVQNPAGAPQVSKPTLEPSAKVEKPAPAKPKPAPAAPAPEPERDRFDFYEMLPKSKVEPPEESAYHSTPKTAKLETKILLQAGSFRSADDAEQMRARMILAGLPDVKTSRTEGSNGVWYRVRTGPFDTRADVNAAANKLYKLNINPLEIRAQ
ncbi:SPOR domain-containing protein [Marinobacterium mangrovicola]|uniref:Sporulation related protein n=1 Tax=Marinobacterium mangrovicola TaxID=1476959 RepID=A0A4R1GKC3_9GAMM|nr:SPOR domain-containing protein [Marinobacterium mangrovicola]TCK04742.1 sporulation related protein [Marinobacterium mangrovicola]